MKQKMKRIKTHNPKNIFKIGQKVWKLHENKPTEFYVEEIHHKSFSLHCDHPSISTTYYLTKPREGLSNEKALGTERVIFKTKKALMEDFLENNA